MEKKQKIPTEQEIREVLELRHTLGLRSVVSAVSDRRFPLPWPDAG